MKILQELSEMEVNPVVILKTKSLMSCYREIHRIAHHTPSNDRPINCVFDYEAAVILRSVSFKSKKTKEAESDFKGIFEDELSRKN